MYELLFLTVPIVLATIAALAAGALRLVIARGFSSLHLHSVGAIHPVVWFENQDGAGTLQNLAALADPFVPGIWRRDGDNNDLLRPTHGYNKIFGVFAGIDATVQPRARITATSFRDRYKRTAYEIPILSSTAEPGSPPAFNDLRFNPIEVLHDDSVGVETLNNPAAAADQFVVAFVGDQVTPVDPKALTNGFWIRGATTAAALTANTWGNRAITLDERLTPGRYGVYGAHVLSTSLICARLFDPHQLWRPPILGRDARTDIPHPSFAMPGGWGRLCSFDTENPLSVDLLVDDADNEAQPVDLFLVPESLRK